MSFCYPNVLISIEAPVVAALISQFKKRVEASAVPTSLLGMALLCTIYNTFTL